MRRLPIELNKRILSSLVNSTSAHSSASASEVLMFAGNAKKQKIVETSLEVAAKRYDEMFLLNKQTDQRFISTRTVSALESEGSEKLSTGNNSQKFGQKAIWRAVDFVWTSVTNPKLFYIWAKEGTRWTVDTYQHSINGIKVLGQDLKQSKNIIYRLASGYSVSRREKLKLLQTRTDFLKVFPVSVFIFVPGMVFLLPSVLRHFPNIVPSTFQYPADGREIRRRQKRLRLELAPFVQEVVGASLLRNLIEALDDSSMKDKMDATMHRLFTSQKNDLKALSEKFPKEVLSFRLFCLKSRMGEPIPKNVLTYLSRVFVNIDLEQLSRPELVVLCKYMILSTQGDTEHLRYQVLHKLKTLRHDDMQILWEGLDSLDPVELRQACQDRGMCTTGLTEDQLRQQLSIWLSLSMNREVSPLLLLLYSANQLQQRLCNVTP